MQWEPSESDHVLLTAWVRGDSKAATAFVKKYYHHAFVIGLGYSRGDKDRAETAVQVFFERLARKLPVLWQEDRVKFEALSHNFSAYLLAGLKNNVKEQQRSSSRYQAKMADQASRQTPHTVDVDTHQFIREDAIHYVLSFLPESQRLVYQLYLEGYSYQEIGQKIGLNQGQVRGRIDRGNQKLKKHRHLIHQLLQP